MSISLLPITLSLLEKNADYDELTTACNPIWGAIKSVTETSDKRMKEYSEWFDAAEKIQKAGGALDDDQEMLLDRVDSFSHDESFIFHTSRNGLAWSLILVVSKMLSRDFDVAASTLDMISPTFKAMKWKEKVKVLYALGSSISGQPWSMSVRAASNYVRHRDEWDVKTLKKVTIKGKEELVKITDPLVDQLSPDQKPSATTLIAIGINETDLFGQTDQSYKICDILRLLDENDLNALFYDWNDALKKYLLSMNGK